MSRYLIWYLPAPHSVAVEVGPAYTINADSSAVKVLVHAKVAGTDTTVLDIKTNGKSIFRTKPELESGDTDLEFDDFGVDEDFSEEALVTLDIVSGGAIGDLTVTLVLD